MGSAPKHIQAILFFLPLILGGFVILTNWKTNKIAKNREIAIVIFNLSIKYRTKERIKSVSVIQTPILDKKTRLSIEYTIMARSNNATKGKET